MNRLTKYNNPQSKNMGQLINAENILLNDTTGLNAFLSTFNPENNAEANMQIVLAMYKETYGLQLEEFNTNQINTLISIAMQSPISGGEAVYIARGMLHLDVDDLIDNYNQRKSQLANLVNKEVVEIVYPNPATNYVIVDLGKEDDKTVLFYLYNSLNEKVIEKSFVYNQEPVSIDLSNIHNGLYFYSVILTNGKQFHGKIIINR